MRVAADSLVISNLQGLNKEKDEEKCQVYD